MRHFQKSGYFQPENFLQKYLGKILKRKKAELNIINAWHTETPRLNKRAASLYGDSKEWWGFSGIITVPMEHVDDFAIILRFSE